MAEGNLNETKNQQRNCFSLDVNFINFKAMLF